MNPKNVQMLTDLLNHLSCGEPFPLAGADGVAEMVDASIVAEELAKRGVLNPAALTDDECRHVQEAGEYYEDDGSDSGCHVPGLPDQVRDALARVARGEAP